MTLTLLTLDLLTLDLPMLSPSITSAPSLRFGLFPPVTLEQNQSFINNHLTQNSLLLPFLIFIIVIFSDIAKSCFHSPNYFFASVIKYEAFFCIM